MSVPVVCEWGQALGIFDANRSFGGKKKTSESTRTHVCPLCLFRLLYSSSSSFLVALETSQLLSLQGISSLTKIMKEDCFVYEKIISIRSN